MKEFKHYKDKESISLLCEQINNALSSVVWRSSSRVHEILQEAHITVHEDGAIIGGRVLTELFRLALNNNIKVSIVADIQGRGLEYELGSWEAFIHDGEISLDTRNKYLLEYLLLSLYTQGMTLEEVSHILRSKNIRGTLARKHTILKLLGHKNVIVLFQKYDSGVKKKRRIEKYTTPSNSTLERSKIVSRDYKFVNYEISFEIRYAR